MSKAYERLLLWESGRRFDGHHRRMRGFQCQRTRDTSLPPSQSLRKPVSLEPVAKMVSLALSASIYEAIGPSILFI